MANETQRSADVLESSVSQKIESDEAFRKLIADEPAKAVAEIKSLAGTAKSQTDASGSSLINVAEAESARSAASADKLVYIIAVASLGLVALIAVGTIYFVAAPQVAILTDGLVKAAGNDPAKLAAAKVSFSVPDGLIALGSAAIGALAGLLGPLSQRK